MTEPRCSLDLPPKLVLVAWTVGACLIGGGVMALVATVVWLAGWVW